MCNQWCQLESQKDTILFKIIIFREHVVWALSGFEYNTQELILMSWLMFQEDFYILDSDKQLVTESECIALVE